MKGSSCIRKMGIRKPSEAVPGLKRFYCDPTKYKTSLNYSESAIRIDEKRVGGYASKKYVKVLDEQVKTNPK